MKFYLFERFEWKHASCGMIQLAAADNFLLCFLCYLPNLLCLLLLADKPRIRPLTWNDPIQAFH